MAKKTPPRTDFDLGDLIAAGYQQNRQQESASDEPLVGPQTQRLMDGMPAKERGVTGALKDTAVQLAEGANSVLGAIPSLVAPHSRAANFFEKNAGYWREAQSDDIKSRTQAASAAIDAADEDGVIAQVVEAARQYSSDPALAARFVVTNLPSLIPGIGAAKVAQAASLAKSARAAGVATKALGIGAKAKAAAAATTAGGLVNAGLNAGGARGDAFTEVKQAALESGMSEAEAEDLALSKSVMPAVVGGIAGFVSGKTGIERSLFGAGTKKSATKAATASIVSEMGGEQLEELAPKLATNLQAGEIDGRSLSKDVGRTMVETAIGAGPSSLMAGGVEAIKAAQERKQAAVTSAQASGGIASRAGLAANGHATAPPAAPTQAPVAPIAQTDPSEPVILAQQEIAAMRSAPELDEAETRRLQFLEENLGDPKTLAELYGMEYNPPPAQPDQATPPEAPATLAGVSASGEPSAGPQVDPDTGEILGAPVEDEPASAGEPPQAPMFDEQGQVVPEHDPLAGRTDEDLKEQRLNALSGKVKRSINEELKRSSDSAPPEPEAGELDVSDTAPWRRNIGKAKKLADQLGINHKGMKLPALTEAIERASGTRKADVAGDITGGKIDNDWSSFSEQSGTLGIPRSDMPQIKAEHRGAMVNFLKGKGIEATPETIPSRAIKPTQAEFSPEKVKSAMDFTGGDRAIIVSADGHVVDGHHQWLAKREKGEPIKALRLDANIREVLDALKDMPSAQAEQAASEEQIERDAIQSDDAPVAIPQNQDDDIPGFDDLISKPNTVLSAAGDSKQFTSYAKWINDGKIVSPGMREQIQSDERLAEGEAGLLLAMVDKRGDENAQPETLESLRAQALAIEDTLDDSKPDPVAEQKLADLRAKIKALKAPEKAKWLKAITDNNRLAPVGAVQLAVTPKGGITFMGNPEATKAGRAMLGAFNAAKDAGATDAEIAEAIKAGRESDSSGPKPAGEVVGEAVEVVDAPRLEGGHTEPGGFDSDAWDMSRAKTIEESRAAGNTHLDKVPPYVESMRGKTIFYVHDPKVTGVVRTVDNRVNVYVDWSDSYSAEKEMAKPMQDGKKTVYRTSIGPTDLKDYALAPDKRANKPDSTKKGSPNGTEAAETVQAEAQGQEEPAAGPATSSPTYSNFVDDALGLNKEGDSAAKKLEAHGFRKNKSKGSVGDWIKNDKASGRQLSILAIGGRFVAAIGYIKKRGGRDVASSSSLDSVLDGVKLQYPEFFLGQENLADTAEPAVADALGSGEQAGQVDNGWDKSLPEGRFWVDGEGRGFQHPEFAPNKRQQALIDAVERALDAGAFYGEEVQKKVAQDLGVSKEALERNRANVQGGDFGYHVYHARHVVEARRAESVAAKIRADLALKQGDKLGTLIFNDFKVTTGVEVTSVSDDGRSVSLKGKRGSYTVTFVAETNSVKYAIDRAHEKSKRKDGYEDFVKARGVVASTEEPRTPEPGMNVIVNEVGSDGKIDSERGNAGTDTSPDALWRKNWAAARDMAESLGLPTKDGKRNLKLTELVPAIEAKLKQPDSNNEATPSADTSNVIGESANDSIGKQILRAKKTVMRLRTLAKAGDLSLEQKLERKDAVKKAEEALRKMRQNVFSAEDAANAAISAKDASLFAEHKELFPSVYAELAKSIGNPVKASPPASAPAPTPTPTPTPTDAGAPVTSTTLDATNMTPTAVHEALMNGHKLSRHGETVWVGRKTTGTVDSYVVMSKEDDGNMVFTKGPVGASRDIGWGKSEAAGKAIASWDFDTIPVLEAQVAEQDAMLDSVLERLAQQGQVTDGRLEQRRADLEAELEKTRARIRDKKMLATSESVAINDFIEGRRDDAPTVDEVKAEQGANLESIFAGLQADGEAKSQAEQKAAASQFASRIEQVEANFHDALIALMEAGTLKVNGQSAITEDNRACL